MTRLALITDCHLGSQADVLLNGFNVQQRLESVLDDISRWQPQLLVATGDLANHGERDAYRRLAGLLGGLGVPVLVIPGNHDNIDLMRSTLCHGDICWAPRYRVDGWELLLLNSVVPGAPHGEMDTASLEELKGDRGREPALAFVHHHPVDVGSAWIDGMKLTNGAALLDALPDRVQALFFGHVHQNFHSMYEDLAVLGSVSTSYQIQPATAEFGLDLQAPEPGWRSIELGETGHWSSAVCRVGRAGGATAG